MKLRTISIWPLLTVTLILPLILYSMTRYYSLNFSALPVIKPAHDTLESFRNHNQTGNIVSEEDWKGKVIIANFFFTSCPSICPKMTRNLKEVQSAYAGNGHVSINSFSVDPERDSVARLKAYAEKFGVESNHWNLLTGNRTAIYRTARNLLVTATDGDDSRTDFIHSDKLVLIDKNGKIRGYYDGTDQQEVQQLIKDIGKLL